MLGSEQSDVVVGVIDVGAPKNIGWAILAGDRKILGADLDAFFETFSDLADGKLAALGFEAPLFIPTARPAAKLTAQRRGENGRPWSAGAGATVTTIGLAVVTHVLAELRPRLPGTCASLDWHSWSDGFDLLIFEAFVSGDNHAGPGDHALDALSAATAFRNNLGNLDQANAVSEAQVLSLAGACMARTGWAENDLGVLAQSCLVIRPGTAPTMNQYPKGTPT